jgi:FkbM family methyltransferase
VVEAISAPLNRFARAIYSAPQEKRVKPWFAASGDKTLRLDYDLGEDSLVFDLGGYEGQWTSDIFARYCCRVHVFEPVKTYATAIAQRFARNPKIVVHNFGLSDQDQRVMMSLSSDSTSCYRAEEGNEEVQLICAENFFLREQITGITLMKINIEGGEYDLLEHLIASGRISQIENLQVQFHDFVPNAPERMEMIQRKLSETHTLTYQFPFVWENWKRRC